MAAAARYILPLLLILVAIVLAAACTGLEEPPPPDLREPALPGQQLVAAGTMTGNGTRGGTIDLVTFRVGLAPGVQSVDMEKVSVIYADAVRSETLVAVPGLRGPVPPGSWAVLGVEGQEGVANNLVEFDELFIIGLNPRAPIVPGQMITIVLRTPSGTPLTLRRTAPPTIMAENTFLPL